MYDPTQSCGEFFLILFFQCERIVAPRHNRQILSPLTKDSDVGIVTTLIGFSTSDPHSLPLAFRLLSCGTKSTA